MAFFNKGKWNKLLLEVRNAGGLAEGRNGRYLHRDEIFGKVERNL